MASTAASLLGNRDAEFDSLKRAIGCGINSGWLRRVAERRGRGRPEPPDDCWNSEGVWNRIEWLGWAGPKFRREIDAMAGLLGQTEHKQFHEGLESLGKCLGAQTTRTSEAGAPDVVWSFDDDVHIAFEAKTEKAPDSALSKSDVQQAKGHIDWVKSKLADNQQSARIVSVIVSPVSLLDDIAKPYAEELYWVDPNVVSNLAVRADETLTELRQEPSGSEFGQARDTICARLKQNGLHLDGVIELLLQNPALSPLDES